MGAAARLFVSVCASRRQLRVVSLLALLGPQLALAASPAGTDGVPAGSAALPAAAPPAAAPAAAPAHVARSLLVPASAQQRETRTNMIANVERPEDLIAMIGRQLDAQPPATTPEAQAAIARLRQQLATLRRLLERHGSAVGPWGGD